VHAESIIEEKTVGGGWNELLCMEFSKAYWTWSSRRGAHYTWTGTFEGGRAQYACLGSFPSELHIRHQQFHRVVCDWRQRPLSFTIL